MNPVIHSAPTPRRHRSPRHARLILVLAVVAALEIAGASLSAVARAASPSVATAPAPTTVVAGIVATGAGTGAAADSAATSMTPVSRPARPGRLLADEQSGRQAARSLPVRNADQALDPAPPEAPVAPTEPAAEEAPAQSTPADAGDETAAAAGGLAGAGRAAAAVPQRLRIPELRIDQSIRQFPCDRAEPPDDYVYQWGCAGANNLYLLGHAYSVFTPLHDAYVDGRLHVGMQAVFTSADGTVTTYRVTTWRVVRPDQAAWAIAAQPTRSMTLQTCLGANSESRLLVRLVAVD